MIIKNSFIYLLASILCSTISFLMIPIYTSVLATSDFGIYGMILVFSTIFGFFIHMNLFSLLEKDYFHDKKSNLNYIYNMVVFFTLIFVLVLVIALFFQKLLLTYLNISILENWLFLIVLFAYTKVIIDLFLTIFRLKNLSFSYAFVNISLSFSRAFLGYIFVVLFQFTWDGLLISMLVSNFIVLTFLLLRYVHLLLKYKSNYTLNIDLLRQFKHYSLVMFPNTINWRCILFSDRFFIGKMVNLSQLGLYTLGAQLSNILSLVTISFSKAWSPFFMKEMNYNSSSKTIKKYLLYYVMILTGVLWVVYLISPMLIEHFLSVKYHLAISYFKCFIFIVALASLHSILSNYLLYFGLESKISISTTIGMISNFPLNYILILKYGAMGAVIATLLSYLLVAIFEFIFIVWYYNQSTKRCQIRELS